MSKRFRPVHGFVLVLFIVVAVLTAELALEGRLGRGSTRVSPDRDGVVRIELAGLEQNQVRFYRFLNAGNQEVKFFVGRDHNGIIQVGFDAAESDFKMKRGFRFEDGWMVNNKCDSSCRLEEVNEGRGGCRPVPLRHRLDGEILVLAESDVLTGWRYFR